MRVQLYCSDGNLEAYTCEDVYDPSKPIGFQSPLSYVDNSCPPMLLQTGDMDRIVNPINSHAFYKLLKKRGGTVEMITYKDSGHIISHPKQLLCAQERNLEWFTRWL
jgi:dipeptidyl aminopeptidase/acylaminoacyl peptidase